MTGSALERLSAPPSRAAGIVWALVALALMLVGAVLIPALLTEDADPVDLVRWYLGGSVLAFLGFLPLLRAVHGVLNSRATPAWAMAAAYGALLVRPLALSVDVAFAPTAVLSTIPGLGPVLMPYVLLATTGLAAGLAAWAALPLAQSAASPGRRLTVAAGTGILVALALYSFAPYIAPLGALGIAVTLWMRTGSGGRSDRANGPAGQN